MATLIKQKFCWFPMRLARYIEDAPPNKPNMEFIGWVWWKTVTASNNINHGWVTFLDDMPLLHRCSKCGQVIL